MSALIRWCRPAPYLARAGVVLSGYACAPGGQPVTSAAVRLGLAGDRRLIDKTLHVYGDRMGTTVPQPFRRMPLVYERAWGDRANLENPVGVGAAGGATSVPSRPLNSRKFLRTDSV